MAWIESHQSLGTHRKLLALCEALHIDRARAVGMLHFLWWWALDNAPDGDITCISDKVLATASLWKGSPTLWVQTLREVGLVDEDTTSRRLHNWDDYAGKLIAKRLSNQRYQREHRERERKDNVRLTSGLRQGATVPNPTVPNHTIKETIKKEVCLPDWIKQETWDAFLETRKKQRAPPTARAIELLIKELEKLKTTGDDPNEVLCQSIMNNWKGVFPLKKGGSKDATNRRDSTKLPHRYTEPPADPGLDALIAAPQRDGKIS